MGLVPCAFGGTSLSQWFKGTDLYSNAVARTKRAARTGIAQAVLWHQGETGIGNGVPVMDYAAKLAGLMRDFRKDVELPELVFVVGKLGDFVKGAGAKTVNAQIDLLPKQVSNVIVVDAAGLAHGGDSLHFSAAAQREFGARYAAAWLAR